MKIIVAPTDFSDISLNSVNYAADMACVTGTELSLLHVCVMPLSFSEVPVPAYSLEQVMNDAEERLKQLQEKISTRTGGRLKVNTVVRQGTVVREIDDYCADVNVYAVVMGAESAGKFERFLFGGRTIEAVKQLRWPLIVVPPDVKFSSIRQIGLACDFKDVVDTIPVKEIKSMVNEFGAKLHVLHVSNEIGEVFSDETVEESGWLQEIIGDMNPKYHFIKGIDADNRIIEFAEKNKLDLLIIIPKKRNLFTKIFRNSHSKGLVLHSHVPVMVVQ